MSPFVRPRSLSNPALRLVVFHHAGGSSSTYYPLTRKLPKQWELLMLDLPGRGKRHAEAPLTHVSHIVQLAVRDLDPWLDAPIALFGHSFGAIVASEVARTLESLGIAPLWLGVSGRIAPSFERSTRRLHELADDVLLRELLALGGTPERIHELPEFRERFLQVSRADLTAVESYEASPERIPLACPLTAFAGSRDPWAPPSSMLAWGRESRGRFEQRVFPGGHFYFMGSCFDGFTAELVRAVERSDPHVASSNVSVLPVASQRDELGAPRAQGMRRSASACPV